MKNNEINEAFRYLHEHENCLRLYQIDFIKSLQKYYSSHGRLSSRQEVVLFEMAKFLNIESKLR